RLVQIPLGKMAGVDVVDPGAGPVRGPRLVERAGHVVFPELFDFSDLAVLLGQAAEVPGSRLPAPADLVLDQPEHVLTRGSGVLPAGGVLLDGRVGVGKAEPL